MGHKLSSPVTPAMIQRDMIKKMRSIAIQWDAQFRYCFGNNWEIVDLDVLDMVIKEGVKKLNSLNRQNPDLVAKIVRFAAVESMYVDVNAAIDLARRDAQHKDLTLVIQRAKSQVEYCTSNIIGAANTELREQDGYKALLERKNTGVI